MLAKSEAKASARTSSRGQKQQTSPSKPTKRLRTDDKSADAKVAKLRVAQSSGAGSQKDDPATCSSPDNNITPSSASSPETFVATTTRTTTRSNSLDSSNNDTAPSQIQDELPPPRRTSARRRTTVLPTNTSKASSTTRESPDTDNDSDNIAASDEEDGTEEDANSDKETTNNFRSKSNKRTHTSEAMKQKQVDWKTLFLTVHVTFLIHSWQMFNRFENLDQQQVQIREGSHPQYIRLLEDIESKRSEKYGTAEIRRKFAHGAITACYEADLKQANDQFYASLQEDEIEQDLAFARNRVDFDQEDDDVEDEEEEEEEDGEDEQEEVAHEVEHEFDDQLLFPEPGDAEESDHEHMIDRPEARSYTHAPLTRDSRYDAHGSHQRDASVGYNMPRPLAPQPPPKPPHYEQQQEVKPTIHSPPPGAPVTSGPTSAMSSAQQQAAIQELLELYGKTVLAARKPPVNIAPAWARPPPPPEPSGRIDFDLSGPDSPPLETLASLADEQYRQYYSKRSFIVQERIKDYATSKKKKKSKNKSKEKKRGRKPKHQRSNTTTSERKEPGKDVLVS
ncbi:hypothetical protein NQZ79_g4526 [Umbelopsis isabellina]|nr:hypothetical protein NQZ79_g4526 [Umbelopsis isabellina]